MGLNPDAMRPTSGRSTKATCTNHTLYVSETAWHRRTRILLFLLTRVPRPLTKIRITTVGVVDFGVSPTPIFLVFSV